MNGLMPGTVARDGGKQTKTQSLLLRDILSSWRYGLDRMIKVQGDPNKMESDQFCQVVGQRLGRYQKDSKLVVCSCKDGRLIHALNPHSTPPSPQKFRISFKGINQQG